MKNNRLALVTRFELVINTLAIMYIRLKKRSYQCFNPPLFSRSRKVRDCSSTLPEVILLELAFALF